MAPPSDSYLPAPGSLVGSWIVGKQIGIGSYGVVFRAVHKDRPEAGSYALKVARKAGDERFEREAHLLSRVRHSAVPRLEGRGSWRSPDGEDYPYLVMQWKEGMSLYAWAVEYGLTLRQAIGQLAQVARALEATHRHGVHRDVKGGNVRVSPEGQAVLLDFGSCWYPEASPMTGGAMPPCTDKYRSPQMLMFGYALERGWRGSYEAEPADDVYALGVSAYRLLAGGYPPSHADSDGSTKVVPLEAPQGLNDVCPELGELIVRMLAEDPLARGSAREVAEELEALLEYARQELDEPWVANASRQHTAKAEPLAPREPAPPLAPRKPGSITDDRVRPSSSMPPTERAACPGPTRWHLARQALRQHSALLSVAGALVACLLVAVLLPPLPAQHHLADAEEEQTDAGVEEQSVGLSDGGGGEVLASAEVRPPYGVPGFAEPMPQQPRPGQLRPPCPRPGRSINGGCWWGPIEGEKPPCEGAYEYGGRCYVAAYPNQRIPTSEDP